MPRTVSSSEAQNNFGAVVQWAEENKDEVVVEKRGKPTAVIMGIEEYNVIQQLRERDRRRQALDALEELRQEIRSRNPEMTAEEAYRQAGFSDEVIQETLAHDKKLARKNK